MRIDSEDKPLFSLAIAFIASTVVLAVAYPMAKAVTGDAMLAFVIAFMLSIATLKMAAARGSQSLTPAPTSNYSKTPE